MYLSEERIKQLEKMKELSLEFYEVSTNFLDDLLGDYVEDAGSKGNKEIMGKELHEKYMAFERDCFYYDPNEKNFELFTLFVNKVAIELRMKELQKKEGK